MPKKKRQAAKLPKAIAGVRIGKDLRSAIEPVMRFAGHPLVSNLIASALVAGAERLTVEPKEPKRRVNAGKTGANSGDDSAIGLLLAVAAGEIASYIVNAYESAPPKSRPVAGDDRRSGKAPASGNERRSPAQNRRGKNSGRHK